MISNTISKRYTITKYYYFHAEFSLLNEDNERYFIFYLHLKNVALIITYL